MIPELVGEVDGRISVRCPQCKMVQFVAKNNRCRRCQASFEDNPEPEPTPSWIRQDPPMKMIETLPILIRMIREATGLSQSAASSRAGWPRTYMTKLERRSCTPSLNNFLRLSYSLDVHPYWLLKMCETAAGA